MESARPPQADQPPPDPFRDRLAQVWSHHPGFRLMRSPQGPEVLGFLHEVYRRPYTARLAAEALMQRLGERFAGLDPAAWIETWSREDLRLLVRRRDPDGQVWVEPSAACEQLFRWVQEAGGGLVAAESRFGDLLRRLEDLAQGADPDPAARLEALRAERNALDRQIAALEADAAAGRSAPTWGDEALDERAQALVQLGQELLGDFKQVEDNFKAIVRRLYALQVEASNRGEAVAYTLDATEALRRTPQGQSFWGFWSLLLEDAGAERWHQSLARLLPALEARLPHLDTRFLANLKAWLHEAGSRVVATNRILAGRLHSLLQDRRASEGRRSAELLRDLKDLILTLPRWPGRDEVFLEVEGPPELWFQLDRPLGEPPHREASALPETGAAEAPEGLEALLGPDPIQPEELGARVREVWTRRPEADWFDVFPQGAEGGLEEVLALLAWSAGHASTRWDPAVTQVLPLDGEKGLAAPRLILSPAAGDLNV